MRNSDHAVVGGISGLFTYLLHKLSRNEVPSIQGSIGSIILGGFSGTLPDLLEPPTNPNHRSLFHSKLAGLSLTKLCINATESTQIDDKMKLLLKIASSGYLSHLLTDSQSPKGLPWLL